MIGSGVSGRMLQASVQFLQEHNIPEEEMKDINLDWFDVEQPTTNVPFDLASPVVLRFAAKLDMPLPEVASQICQKVLDLEPKDAFAQLMDRSESTHSGYLNFLISELGIQEWLMIVLAAAKELEPRDHGRLIRGITLAATAEPADSDKLEVMRLCARRCIKYVKEARQTRFDVEQQLELPPLIKEATESAFLRACIEDIAGLVAHGEADEKTSLSFGSPIRKLIVTAGLLVDDLIRGGVVKAGGVVIPLRTIRTYRHAFDLANAWNEFFDHDSVVSQSLNATRLRIALLLASGRLLTFADTLAEFVASKNVATSR